MKTSYGFNTVYSLANCYIAITFITIWSKRLEYCFQLIRREYSRRYSIIKRDVTHVVIHKVYFIGHTNIPKTTQIMDIWRLSNKVKIS